MRDTLTDLEQLIADLQRQLSECKTERDEALQRETATAEELQVINVSPGNLTPVFDAILEKALSRLQRHFRHGAFPRQRTSEACDRQGITCNLRKLAP